MFIESLFKQQSLNCLFKNNITDRINIYLTTTLKKCFKIYLKNKNKNNSQKVY